jgi:hypothetical protein
MLRALKHQGYKDQLLTRKPLSSTGLSRDHKSHNRGSLGAFPIARKWWTTVGLVSTGSSSYVLTASEFWSIQEAGLGDVVAVVRHCLIL